MRSSRLPLLVSAASVLSIAVAVAAPASASPTGVVTAHAHASVTRYAVARHDCAAPRPGQLSCFAMRLVPASRTTPGAVALTTTARNAVPKGPSGFGLTPADLAKAYGYDRSKAVHQVVGIVDAFDDPNAATDLAGFEANYGMVGTGGLVKVGQSGSPTKLPKRDKAGWSSEESLDIDAVRAVCETCTILLVEANSARIRDLSAAAATAIRLGANEVSNSYGGSEKLSHMSKTVAARYSHHGVVVTASTGDAGWYGWGFAVGFKSQSSPSQPATLPGVVAVGGTHLALTPRAHRRNETVWNNFGPQAGRFENGKTNGGATGGGCSTINRAPIAQRHVKGFAKTGCGNKRLAADISADGDPQTGLDVLDTYYCGRACAPSAAQMPQWQTIGGTSLSSPLIAAMWALAGGAPGASRPAATLYARYATKGHAGVYDVRQGGNAYCDMLSAKACKRFHGAPIAVNQPHHYGRIDCRYTNSGKNIAVKHHSQCIATRGFDGPSGIGAPNTLRVFTPLPKPAVG
jgi:Subtilase family